MWDVQTGTAVLALYGHTGVVTGIAFSPDGTRLASCGADKKILIWVAPGRSGLKKTEGR
jgi:WD40 repeat protein